MAREVPFALPLLPTSDESRVPPDRVSTQVQAMRHGRFLDQADWLAAEEPLEIRVEGTGQAAVRVAVTMRTPGHDRELAVGFLYTEGLLTCRDDVVRIDPSRSSGSTSPCNVVTVRLSHPFDATALQRNFFATSSCGVCGKTSLEQIAIRCAPVAPGPVFSHAVLAGLSKRMRQTQHLFEQTGGVHAAGLFDLTGDLLSLQEDVGRHNAVDKLVGEMVLAGKVPLAEQILLVSGRTSFEILQKTALAGIPMICAVSAPSSLAVDVARQFGVTLVGFLREHGFNVYTHPERIRREY